MLHRLAPVPMVLALLAGGLSAPPAAAQAAEPSTGSQPRTYFESLDMHTPRASLDGFLAAWQAADYQRVYFHLSPDARLGFMKTLLSVEVDKLLKERGPTGKEAFDAMQPGNDAFVEELTSAQSLAFDRVMRFGAQHGLLPLAIHTAQALPAEVAPTATTASFEVRNGGAPRELHVDMVRVPSGRWHVDRIRWAGSDPDRRPWGIGTPAP